MVCLATTHYYIQCTLHLLKTQLIKSTFLHCYFLILKSHSTLTYDEIWQILTQYNNVLYGLMSFTYFKISLFKKKSDPCHVIHTMSNFHQETCSMQISVLCLDCYNKANNLALIVLKLQLYFNNFFRKDSIMCTFTKHAATK